MLQDLLQDRKDRKVVSAETKLINQIGRKCVTTQFGVINSEYYINPINARIKNDKLFDSMGCDNIVVLLATRYIYIVCVLHFVLY